MKFQLVTIIALVTIARDALATPMDHNDETDNHANVPALYKRKARSSRKGTLEQLGGPGPFAVQSFGGIAAGEVAGLSRNKYVKHALSAGAMLSTTLLAFSGTTGMIIGAAISAFAFIFGALFGKRYRPPPPSEKYSEIQPYITKQVSEYVSDLQKEQLNNKLGLTGFIMQEYFEEYEDAIVHSKIEIRMSALDNIIRVLRALSEHETFAMAPSTFENAENFLLMKAGTNKCFGPPAGTEGKPTFRECKGSDCTYQLYDCSDLAVAEQNIVKDNGNGELVFETDQLPQSQKRYCPSTILNKITECASRFCQPIPPTTGTLIHSVGTCNDATSFTMSYNTNPETKAMTVKMDFNGELRRPYRVTKTHHLTCGGCEGDHGEASEVMGADGNADKCYFISNADNTDKCHTEFKLIPHLKTATAELLYPRLVLFPFYMRFHLIALMERYVLGRLSDDPFVQKLCSDFNVARDLWSGTFDAMLNHFAIIPSSNATFVAAEVPRLRALVDSLLDEKYTCEQAGETLSNLIKVNSVVLGGTEFDFGELTEKLKREVEQYKLFIISEQDRKYAESLAPPASD